MKAMTAMMGMAFLVLSACDELTQDASNEVIIPELPLKPFDANWAKSLPKIYADPNIEVHFLSNLGEDRIGFFSYRSNYELQDFGDDRYVARPYDLTYFEHNGANGTDGDEFIMFGEEAPVALGYEYPLEGSGTLGNLAGVQSRFQLFIFPVGEDLRVNIPYEYDTEKYAIKNWPNKQQSEEIAMRNARIAQCETARKTQDDWPELWASLEAASDDANGKPVPSNEAINNHETKIFNVPWSGSEGASGISPELFIKMDCDEYVDYYTSRVFFEVNDKPYLMVIYNDAPNIDAPKPKSGSKVAFYPL